MGHTRVAVIALLAAALLAPAWAGEPAALAGRSAMEPVVLTLRNTDGGQLQLHAWAADQPLQRRQGFRGLDAEQARGLVLLHRLAQPDLRPWSMREVSIPLEVFWLDASGRVFQAVSLYTGHDLYQPERAVSSALQAFRGELSSQGVGRGSRIASIRPLERP